LLKSIVVAPACDVVGPAVVVNVTIAACAAEALKPMIPTTISLT